MSDPQENMTKQNQEAGELKKIEAEQRQDAADVVTEKTARKYVNTGNEYYSAGMHTSSGKIYDTVAVGRAPTPEGGRTSKDYRRLIGNK